ncbi:MAG: 16S rRNA (guanine(527)-N(7))-methyltransferase RsmG [Rickettsiales bacterium]
MRHNSNVSCETFSSIAEYILLLRKWNASINLISQNDLDVIFKRHINDCILLKNILEENNPDNILDIGSGNGLPGIILSIAMPERRLYLNDIDKRKSAFLLEVIVKLRLNAEVISLDIRKLDMDKFSVITAKAFTSLVKMLETIKRGWEGKVLYMMKGIKSVQEIEQARQKGWIFDVRIHELSEKSVILCVSNITRKHG